MDWLDDTLDDFLDGTWLERLGIAVAMLLFGLFFFGTVVVSVWVAVRGFVEFVQAIL